MSERRLSEIAKVLRQPEGIVGSEFTRINKAARKAGIRFDLWQQGFLWLLFAKNAEGKYACGADGAVLSSCRQIGKTFTVGTALFLKAILTPNLKAIWTAHHTRTSDETFADMCEMEHNPVLGRYVERIRRANGQQEITFTSGSRIMFGARENGFGRGLHSVDVAVFDEAQILTVRAMDNMIPVLNTSPNPLVVYMGNPPKPGDQCDAFTEKRMHALNHDGNLLYVELAADKDADSDDREQWAKANPSYPKRTSEQAIMRMRNNLSDDSFRREALGIWDETATAYAISPDLWQAAAVDDVPEGGTMSFGIDMPPDRSVLTIGAALRYADGSAIVQMANIKDARQAGTMWAVDWLAEHWPKTASVVIDAQSPAMSLLPELKKAIGDHTVTVLQALKAAGVSPKWVQVGNEIRPGMLWDKNVALSGASYDVKECDLKNAPATASDKVVYPANWSNLADFITEGYNAVKSVFSDAIVIVHLDNGWDKELFNWFFDELKKHNGK